MTTRLSEPGTLLDETASEAVVTPPISAVARTLRSPVFVAVVFVATVVQVCSDPVLAIFSGTGQWDHTLPPQAVIALTAFICLAQAVCVSRSGTRPELGVLGAVACYLVVAVALGVPTWATPMQLVIAISMAALGSARRIPVSATWAAGTVALSAVALGGWAALGACAGHRHCHRHVGPAT